MCSNAARIGLFPLHNPHINTSEKCLKSQRPKCYIAIVYIRGRHAKCSLAESWYMEVIFTKDIGYRCHNGFDHPDPVLFLKVLLSTSRCVPDTTTGSGWFAVNTGLPVEENIIQELCIK